MRVGVGYALAVGLGLPIGLLMGWFPCMQGLLNALFQMLRPISPLAWIPLAIILIGVNNTAAIFLVFIASFFPIVVSATNGVRNVPPMYMRGGVQGDQLELTTFDAQVDLRGIIYLYNPPDPAKLGSGSSSAPTNRPLGIPGIPTKYSTSTATGAPSVLFGGT